MNLKAFYQKQIEKWEVEREIARDNGDYPRYAFCEREIDNYGILMRQMGEKDESE